MEARKVIAVAAAALTAGVVWSGVASAHVPEVTADCGTLSVNIHDYQLDPNQPDVLSPNSVIVRVDAVEKDNAQFGESFVKTYPLGDSAVAHVYTVDIHAFDDPNGDNGWTKVFEGQSVPCVPPPPTPTPVATLTPVPMPTPTVTPSVLPTHTAKPTPVATLTKKPAPSSSPAAVLPFTGGHGIGATTLVGAALLIIGWPAVVFGYRRRRTQ